jgi:hypothetical protein
VTDPASGKTYYTQKIGEGRGGAVKIKDARTMSTVTLQSSEVKEISADEYEQVWHSRVTTQPPVAK